MPESLKSKQPTSSLAPNLFLIARIKRSVSDARLRIEEQRRRCVRADVGPAIEPSL